MDALAPPMDAAPWQDPGISDGPATVEPRPPQPSLFQRLSRALAAAISAREILLTLGLALVGRGCYLLHPAAGWGVPGAIIIWWALPQRPRFLEPKPPTPKTVNVMSADPRWTGGTDGRS